MPEAFQQGQGGCLLAFRAGDAADFRQADADAVAEQQQVSGDRVVGDGGQSLAAGGVRGVDEGAQLVGDLAGPDRVRVRLGGVLKVAQQVLGAQLVAIAP